MNTHTSSFFLISFKDFGMWGVPVDLVDAEKSVRHCPSASFAISLIFSPASDYISSTCLSCSLWLVLGDGSLRLC